MIIRPMQPEEQDALRTLYRRAIEHAGPQAYTPEQVAAWARFANEAEFADWVTGAQTFVAQDASGRLQGFGALATPDHLSALFVAPEFMRQGVGTALLEMLLQQADTKHAVTVAASEFSKPLFERYGFEVECVEQSRRDGVVLTRYAMIRHPEGART